MVIIGPNELRLVRDEVSLLEYIPGGQHAAIAAGTSDYDATADWATAVGEIGARTLLLPHGTVRGNFSMSGGSGSLRGLGDCSILKGLDSANAPVLDFTGYSWPANATSPREFCSFRVLGDGGANTTRKGIYLGYSATHAGGASFHHLSVKDTGGIPLDCGDAVLSHFQNITLFAPVSAKANDVPYIYGKGSMNANRFIGIALRSTAVSADVGASGAARFEDDGSYCPSYNLFLGWWYEYLHVPTNGTLFHLEGAINSIADFQFADCSKESGATGTSFLRLAAPAIGNNGGNEVRGYIPGNGAAALSIDTGVQVEQSRNRIVGVKGYRGANVTLALGVGFTTIMFGGEESGATDAAVTDNSGQTTNMIIDSSQGVNNQTKGLAVVQDLYMGSTSGPRQFPISTTQAYHRASLHVFQGIDGEGAMQIVPSFGPKLPAYTVATRPSAATHAGVVIYVTDASAGENFQASHGSAWVPLG